MSIPGYDVIELVGIAGELLFALFADRGRVAETGVETEYFIADFAIHVAF
jgi:hypothetical protein